MAQHVKKVNAVVSRLLDATIMTPCISILDTEENPTLRAAKKKNFQLVKQIHPDKLGINVNKADGLEAARVLTRAMELCILDAEFSAYTATGDPNAVADLDHILPEHLFFTFEDTDNIKSLLAAQQRAFEDEEERLKHKRAEEKLEREEKEEAEAAVADAEDGQANYAYFGGMNEEDDSDAGDEGDGFVPDDEFPENRQTNFAVLFIPAAPEEEAEDMDRSYPSYEGEQGTADHHDYLIKRKQVMRQRARSFSSKNAKTKAKNRLLSEGLASLLWAPLPIGDIVAPVLGMTFTWRWQCEQWARGLAAKLGLQEGINITKDHEQLISRCRASNCKAVVVFDLQRQGAGCWKLNRAGTHKATCFGLPTPDGESTKNARLCRSAYLPHQLANLVKVEAAENPAISGKEIGQAIARKNIFLRPPNPRLFRSVGSELQKNKEASRAVQMAAIEGYAELLRNCGHTVRICSSCSLRSFSHFSTCFPPKHRLRLNTSTRSR